MLDKAGEAKNSQIQRLQQTYLFEKIKIKHTILVGLFTKNLLSFSSPCNLESRFCGRHDVQPNADR